MTAPGRWGRLSAHSPGSVQLRRRPFELPHGPRLNPAVVQLQPGQRCLVLALVPNGLPGEGAMIDALLLPEGSLVPGWTWWTAELYDEEERMILRQP